MYINGYWASRLEILCFCFCRVTVLIGIRLCKAASGEACQALADFFLLVYLRDLQSCDVNLWLGVFSA